MVIEGLVEKDKILTLSANEAERRGFADFIAAGGAGAGKYGFDDARSSAELTGPRIWPAS